VNERAAGARLDDIQFIQDPVHRLAPQAQHQAYCTWAKAQDELRGLKHLQWVLATCNGLTKSTKHKKHKALRTAFCTWCSVPTVPPSVLIFDGNGPACLWRYISPQVGREHAGFTPATSRGPAVLRAHRPAAGLGRGSAVWGARNTARCLCAARPGKRKFFTRRGPKLAHPDLAFTLSDDRETRTASEKEEETMRDS
jgi:hypothetical protein